MWNLRSPTKDETTSDLNQTRPGELLGKIGVLGGSFDPPHNGHLEVARAATAALSLDEVIFLPNNRNPLKQRDLRAKPEQRMEMVKLLIKNEPKVAVSDIELTRGGLSYAVETLAELQMVQPANYWFILGSDTLKEFDQWKSPSRLLKMCRLAVVNRDPNKPFIFPSNLPAEIRDFVDVVPMTSHKASSTEIKERLLGNKDLTGYLPESVLSYIRANKLYQL